MSRLFPTSRLGARVEHDMERELSRRLEFVLRWTKSRNIVVIGLDTRRGSEPWRPVITKPIAENDGEIVLDLGPQGPGTIEMKFAVGALSEVPKMAAFVVQGGNQVTKVAPLKPDEFKQLKAFERWLEDARYDVAPLA